MQIDKEINIDISILHNTLIIQFILVLLLIRLTCSTQKDRV